jgi:exodeoxyribonuclease VII large subunit
MALPNLDRILAVPRQKYDFLADKLPLALKNIVTIKRSYFFEKSSTLSPLPLKTKVQSHAQEITYYGKQQDDYIQNFMTQKHTHLESLKRMLEIMSYKAVLKRGFVAVKKNDGHYLTEKPKDLAKNSALTLEFYDGDMAVVSQ